MFRKQAIEKQQIKLYGDIVLTQPITYRMVSFLLVIIFTAVIYLLINGEFSRKESVAGYLVPKSGLLKVKTPRSGFVQDIAIVNGERVEARQNLLSINDPRVLFSGEVLSQQLIDQLAEKSALLQGQMNASDTILLNQKQELSEKITALDASLQSLESQQNLVDEQIILAQRQLDRVRSLAKKKLIADTEVEQARSAVLNLQSRHAELSSSMQTAKSNQSQFSLQLDRLPIEAANTSAQFSAQLLDIERQKLQLESETQGVIEAPSDGVISQILVKPNDYIQAGTVVFHLAPADAQLRAELLVPTTAIGFVEVGQTVNIRYSAFAYQKFGIYHGVVASVGSSLLSPDEMRDLPITPNQGAYKVIVDLDQQYVSAYGKQMPLTSGMLVEADIRLESRAIWEWLLEPILSLKGRL